MKTIKGLQSTYSNFIEYEFTLDMEYEGLTFKNFFHYLDTATNSFCSS